MGKAQREKGKRGERELAGILRDYGYDTRRGQQFCGSDGSADVVGLPGSGRVGDGLHELYFSNQFFLGYGRTESVVYRAGIALLCFIACKQ